MILLGVIALLSAAAGNPGSANGQSSLPSADLARAQEQCPEDQLSASPIAAQLRELALKPGVRIDPASFMKDPHIAEFVSQASRQEQARRQRDWSGLCRYRGENVAQRAKGNPDVVFLGDSITENWRLGDPAFFSDQVIDRGISGQTSSQMLLRFHPDVVALRPKVVHIMAGTNDILQNTGPVGDDDIVNNINAMIDIAKANGIKVVLASIPPISVRSWQPDLRPAQRLIGLNQRLQALAISRRVAFIDYFSALKDAGNGLNADLGNDGVHPNRAGYAVMRQLADHAIAQALHRRR